mmetsp:Transcript_35584/g.69823  ORF Transcript_35584/g.69823 Transcript_35584/m.69823 type:complete len:226 (-) Transcript_35584:584-1261(-)
MHQHKCILHRTVAAGPLAAIAVVVVCLLCHSSQQLALQPHLCHVNPVQLSHQQRRHQRRHLYDIWALVRVCAQQLAHNGGEEGRVVAAYGLVLALHNLLCHSQGVVAGERGRQHRQLVQQTTQAPYVCLHGVGLVHHDLWAGVADGPHYTLHHYAAAVLLPRQPEVSDLDPVSLALLVNHDVGRRQVSVHNPLLHVQVGQGQDQLDEDGPDLLLRQPLPLLLHSC